MRSEAYSERPRRRRRGGGEPSLTHQRLSRFPVELLAQELDHGLKAVRDRHPEEVLFHYRRISDRLEAHDDCKRATNEHRRTGLASWRISVQETDDGTEPLAGSFFLYDSKAARPSARLASAAGSEVSGGDKCGMASGVSAMQNVCSARGSWSCHSCSGNCRQLKS